MKKLIVNSLIYIANYSLCKLRKLEQKGWIKSDNTYPKAKELYFRSCDYVYAYTFIDVPEILCFLRNLIKNDIIPHVKDMRNENDIDSDIFYMLAENLEEYIYSVDIWQDWEY